MLQEKTMITIPRMISAGGDSIMLFLPLFRSKFLITIKICYADKYMLFNKKHQKKVQIIWAVLCTLIIISMVLLYAPGLFS